MFELIEANDIEYVLVDLQDNIEIVLCNRTYELIEAHRLFPNDSILRYIPTWEQMDSCINLVLMHERYAEGMYDADT